MVLLGRWGFSDASLCDASMTRWTEGGTGSALSPWFIPGCRGDSAGAGAPQLSGFRGASASGNSPDGSGGTLPLKNAFFPTFGASGLRRVGEARTSIALRDLGGIRNPSNAQRMAWPSLSTFALLLLLMKHVIFKFFMRTVKVSLFVLVAEIKYLVIFL